MKHFFDQSIVLDDAALSELLRTARQELKKKPMNLAEMSSKMDLVCFNGSASDQYMPRGFDSLVALKNMNLNQKISKGFNEDLKKLVESTPGDVFGYLLGNITTKNIFNYLDILFELNFDYKFKPQVVTHFSYDELTEYLADFLNGGVVDGTKRKIEVFDDRSSRAWQTISKSRELDKVEKSIREPVVLDKPFFTDIHLNITKGGRPQVMESSIGKLKAAVPYFNKFKASGGELVRSKNKLFFKIRDIKSFKVASSQSKNLLGISVKGEFIASNQFITHDIGLKHLNISDIDFFSLKVGKTPVDVRLDQITSIEVNLDTQQIIFSRGIGSDENHIARFNKLKLFKDERSVFIHKLIAFNRGASNFEQIQTFFASRYTEYEKARQILTARGELGLLSARNVCSGDLTSYVALSSMNLLGLIPLEVKSLGFAPDDINNRETTSKLFEKEFKELQKIFENIVDVSRSPDFTEHNFLRLSKEMRDFIIINDPSTVKPETFKSLIDELESLTDYMDNFFKLSLYNDLKGDLDVEAVPDFDDQEEEFQMEMEEEESRLDDKTKQFISENFSFFKKRDLVQKALLKIEKVMFYNNNIKKYSDDQLFEPDLMVYSSPKNQIVNYQYAAFPAFDLSSVFSPEILTNKNETDELYFVKFMRDFTQRTFQKARELNKTFHHQYKHTLAELTFRVDEKLQQLQNELDFIEKPENREDAYQKLYERIHAMFLEQLAAKQKNIDDLEKEEKQVRKKLSVHKQKLEKLLGQEIADEELEATLIAMPDKLEDQKNEILQRHKSKLNETQPIFQSFVHLHLAALNYFNNVLSYSTLFQKALWMHRFQKMIDDSKKQSKSFFGVEPEVLANKEKELEAFQADPALTEKLKGEIAQLTENLKEALEDLQKIPAGELFKSPKTADDKLSEYLEYHKDESIRLTRLMGMLQKIYQQMNQIQNQLFKKQEELVLEELKVAKNEFMLKIIGIIKANPEGQEEIQNLQEQTENIPKEIKNELGNLRSVLIEALNGFKSSADKEKLAAIVDYKTFIQESRKRDMINDLSKELVNFNQGAKAIKKERQGEVEDLQYLKSQEPNLEKVAMSKALPSTRVLLKTQYIPLVEREKTMLNRANQFLAEIISNEKPIVSGLTSTFFRKRHGFPQLCRGGYCIDTTKGAKDHTDKNVYAAYTYLAERYRKGCSPALGKVDEILLEKTEVQSIEGLRNRLSQIWHGHVKGNILCLPPTLNIEEVLDLCEYKDTICKNNPKPKRSQNSIVLLYVQRIDFDQLRMKPDLLEKYNQAILSNIFITIDDSDVYNNRDSIYEALVRATFGNSNDKTSDQITQLLLHGD